MTRIQVGRDVLILGDAEMLRGLPRHLRRHSAVCGVLRRMMSDAYAMRELRQYWASRSLSARDGRRTDHELIEVVEAAVESGAVPAMVLPDYGPAVRTLTVAVPNTTMRRPDTPKPVAQMSAEERVWEVVKRAAARLPRAAGTALVAMFTPENIAIAAGLAAFSAAANLTPLGWAADAVLLGVAVGFGGLAAIQGVKDLFACLALTVNATRDADLDTAAEHLARVVADFGVMWLMALLQERAKRRTGGGQGSIDNKQYRRSSRRRPPEYDDDIFNYYMSKAKSLDVSTEKNSAVFYSGPGNRAKAEIFAIDNQRTTLEMTPGGSWMDAEQLFGPESPLTPAQATKVWATLSARFAARASGNVVAFVEGARPTGIFNSVEYPILTENKNVVNVISGGK